MNHGDKAYVAWLAIAVAYIAGGGSPILRGVFMMVLVAAFLYHFVKEDA